MRRADFQHVVAGEEAQAHGFAVVDEGPDAGGDLILHLTGTIDAALRIEAKNRLKAHACDQALAGKFEEFAKLAIPADQPHILVENGDALTGEIERVLEKVTIVLEGGGGVIDQFQRRLPRHRAPAQQQRQHQSRGGGADGGRQLMLGEAQQMNISLRSWRQSPAARFEKAHKRLPRLLGAQIACHRGLKLPHRRRRAPQAEGLADRRPAGADEDIGLQPLDGAGAACEGETDKGENIGGQTEQHAMHERRQTDIENGGRAQPTQAQRPLFDEGVEEARSRRQRGQQQRIGPDQGAEDEARHGPARRGARPEQPSQERRCDLRNGREGQKTNGGQSRFAGKTEIKVAKAQHRHNGEATDEEHKTTRISQARDGSARLGAQQERHGEVVRHHDGERHAFHDDHGGGGGQAAQQREERDERSMLRQRQGEHRHIPVKRAIGKGEQARHSKRNDEDVDRHEIEGKKPGGGAHIALVAVFHDGHMKLARQQQNGAGGQKRVGDPGGAIERRGEHLVDALAVDGLHHEIAKTIEHPPGHIAAHADEGCQLDDALHGDRHHEAIVMLGGVDLARAEGHGETGEHDGDAHRHIRGGRLVHKRATGLQGIEHRGQRNRNRFQLQRDVWHRADHCDDRDQRRHLL